MREGDFVEVLEVTEVEKENEQKKSNKENFADLVKSETTWLTAIQKKFKLLTSEAVKNKVDEFEIELVCRDDVPGNEVPIGRDDSFPYI